jgi:hypothetical protein
MEEQGLVSPDLHTIEEKKTKAKIAKQPVKKPTVSSA